MAKLTADQEQMAKYWLNDIFQCSGYATPDKDIQSSGYWLMHRHGDPKLNAAARKVISTIYERKFNDIDEELSLISNYKFRWHDSWGTKKPEMLAKYLAWFCSKAHIYWDNTLLSKEEMNEFLNTYLGRALNEYDCFATSKDKALAGAPSSVSGKSRASGVIPAIGYKSSGAHSEHIANLVGIPHEKVMLSSYVYCIIADKTGKNTPCAFITPLASDGSSYAKEKAEKVNMGSGNGYTDCCCWLDDPVAAEAFLMNCKEKFSSKFTGIIIGKKLPDPNGYFMVSTEFGDAYIKASKLNENLLEEIDNIETTEKVADGFEITTEDYIKIFKNTRHMD